MSSCVACVNGVVRTAQAGVQATEKVFAASGKVFTNLEMTNHVVRTFSSVMMMVNRNLETEFFMDFLNAIRIIPEFVTARHWVPKMHEFASGEVLTPRIQVAGGTIPNVLRVASRLTLFVADLCSFVSFLHKYHVLETIALVALGTATLPMFSVIGSVPFISIMTTCGVFGFMFDLADQFRLMNEKGLTIPIFLKMVSDVTKIAYIVLAPYQAMRQAYDLFMLCHIANATSSIASLSAFVYKEVIAAPEPRRAAAAAG